MQGRSNPQDPDVLQQPPRAARKNHRAAINRQRLRTGALSLLSWLLLPIFAVMQASLPDHHITALALVTYGLITVLYWFAWRSQKCPQCAQRIAFLPAEGGVPINELSWEVSRCPFCTADFSLKPKEKKPTPT